MRNIYLIGFMGAGKSTVGRLLAERLGMGFLDTDALVEQRAGMSIPEIFARFGEERFRQWEREVIGEICRKRGTVVALGGGAPMDEGNWRALRESGITVYLRESPETIAARLADDGTRPLLSGYTGEGRLRRIRELLELREPRYLEAHIVIECRGRSPEEIMGEILERLGDADR
ncbi:MAG TPA: shikimate kinase [Candidatus Acetothermia bacterium]|nr:shikimate kinase [Candidatus Acetothermia bacterium]